MSSAARTAKLRLTSDVPRRREALGIVLLGIALFLGLSLISFQVGDRALAGPFGHFCALGAYGLLGVVGYLVVLAVVRSALRVLTGERAVAGWAEWAGMLGGMPCLAILLYLVAGQIRREGFGAGGLVGEYGGALLRATVGTVGTALVASFGLLLGMLGATPLRASMFLRLGAAAGGAIARGARASVGWAGRAAVVLFPGGGDDEDGDDEEEMAAKPAKAAKRSRRKDATEPGPAADSAANDDAALAPAVPPAAAKDPAGGASPAAASMATELPIIVERRFKKEKKAAGAADAAPEQKGERPDFIMSGTGGFRLPPPDFLDYEESGHGDVDRNAMHEMAAKLTETLAVYGVRGKVTEIHPGPVVTMYEFVPEAGIRIAKIAGLADELAMNLEALRVRIVAPIPGKNAVGIEVPNRSRETVYLKEILADESFSRARSKLTLALGKDIAGRPVAVDLAKMPHLLVAGTTGSGKSVSVNTMICSILYGASPEEVRLIMVDPKMLELSVYEGIPHLLLPVVTDPKKANLALRWAVEEMERRYEMLALAGVRDLAGYNRKVDKQHGGVPDEAPAGDTVRMEAMDLLAQASGGSEAMASPAGAAADATPVPTRPGKLPPGAKKLPYIVIIIDEFADLMMVAPKEVETSVARIAQKARAAGIHLLLATQRPSVDVITGLIKANFPSRIAFQVSSKVDSRTILDQSGAEALLGQGDMLFSDRGSALRRVHGCLVTDGEIGKVVDFLKAQGKPVYDMDILKPREEDGAEGGGGDEEIDDALYDQAIQIVAETRQASISMLQRRLRVGYNRAARMIERMEKEGIVGPADGPNRREVRVSPQ